MTYRRGREAYLTTAFDTGRELGKRHSPIAGGRRRRRQAAPHRRVTPEPGAVQSITSSEPTSSRPMSRCSEIKTPRATGTCERSALSVSARGSLLMCRVSRHLEAIKKCEHCDAGQNRYLRWVPGSHFRWGEVALALLVTESVNDTPSDCDCHHTHHRANCDCRRSHNRHQNRQGQQRRDCAAEGPLLFVVGRPVLRRNFGTCLVHIYIHECHPEK